MSPHVVTIHRGLHTQDSCWAQGQVSSRELLWGRGERCLVPSHDLQQGAPFICNWVTPATASTHPQGPTKCPLGRAWAPGTRLLCTSPTLQSGNSLTLGRGRCRCYR